MIIHITFLDKWRHNYFNSTTKFPSFFLTLIFFNDKRISVVSEIMGNPMEFHKPVKKRKKERNQ